jgi:amino acid adenylation domain-containing protein
VSKKIVSYFEQQVRLTPNRTALNLPNRKVNFLQLNSWGNQLARYISNFDLAKGDRIVFSLPRSIEAIIVILATMKLGLTYVPIDPEFPLHRKKFIINDVAPKLIFLDKHTQDDFSSFAKNVWIEDIYDLIKDFSAENFNIRNDINEVFWILYTSGSTGNPKGVLGTQTGSVNRIQWMWKTQPFLDKEICFQNTSFNTVDSIWEMWAPLGKGHALNVYSDEIIKDPRSLIPQLGRDGVYRICLVPSLLSTILSLYPEIMKIAPRLKLWVTSGEPLPIDVCKKFYELIPDGIILNQYGLTETCADITSFDTRNISQDSQEYLTVPIGTPIENVNLFIVNSENQRVNDGIEGELCVTGKCLALGYYNLPEMTNQKFVYLPGFKKYGKALKTGDLVRQVQNGNLEYLGRIDQQVKIRGFRVEPIEVEIFLRKHPGIKEAAVASIKNNQSETSLIAYIKFKENEFLDVQELRSFLSEYLPDYMIPGDFKVVNDFIYTSSGKIDRKAMEEKNVKNVFSGSLVAPENKFQENMLEIWKEILKVDKIGIKDNFFNLGGHSLLAVKLLARVENDFKITISLRDFFNNATIFNLTSLIENFSNNINDDPIFCSRKSAAHFPLTYAQERIWYLCNLYPDSPFYNFNMAAMIKGIVKIDLLEKSINFIIKKHDSFRTIFVEKSGVPFQSLSPYKEMSINLIDLTDRNDVSSIEINSILKQEAQKLINLADGPIVQFAIIKISKNLHYLLIRTHHIVCDGWSVSIIMEDLVNFYSKLLNDPSYVFVDETTLFYRDYASWQRQQEHEEKLNKQLLFWKQYLDKCPELLKIPCDKPRPVMQTYCGCIFTFNLKPLLVKNLKMLARASGCTLFTILLAAFKVLLYRYSGQDDVVVGTPLAARKYQSIEKIVGLFANTIAIRTDLSGNPTFLALVKRLREVLFSVFENQDIPFEKLVKELDVNRSQSHSPIFQNMFILQNVPMPSFELESLHIQPLEIDLGIAKFDLTFTVFDWDNELKGNIEYNSDLFNQDTIARLFNSFEIILNECVENPLIEIGRIPVLTETEKNIVISNINCNNSFEYEGEHLYELFEKNVARFPERIALIFNDAYISYQQLMNLVDALAIDLNKAGVQKDEPVAICIDRSIEMVMGLLAILKSGAAYLPLDPLYPLDRIHWMLSDAKSKVVLAQKKYHYIFKNHKILKIEIDLKNYETCDNKNKFIPQSKISRNDLAYVIYTSGSTGKPKGVMVEHGNVLSYLAAMDNVIYHKDPVVWIALTSICFDISVTELFWPLTRGHTVAIHKNNNSSALDLKEYIVPEVVLNEIQKYSVTHLQCTPSYMEMLLEQESAVTIILKLEQIFIGGDVLPGSLVAQLKKIQAKKITNMYGPTEATVWSSFYSIEKAVPTIPIGRPLANTSIFILDKFIQPTMLGAYGEIYISGKGITRGYWGREDLTQERYVFKSLLSSKPICLYKTGDIGRLLPDGNLECLGRNDYQVKLRGYRLELAEIEAEIIKYPHIMKSVVLVQKNEMGDKKIVAFVLPDKGQKINERRLLEKLRKNLPGYMLPSFFVFVECYPLTPNGKIDRNALLKELATFRKNEIVEIPTTKMQKKMEAIWKEYLELKFISIDKNFFELGGHSLLAMKVVAKINHVLQTKVTIKDFIENPTINLISSKIESMRNNLSLSAMDERLEKVDRNKDLPLSYTQESFLYFKKHKNSNIFDIGIRLEINGFLDVSILEEAVNILLKKHEVLRCYFQEKNNIYYLNVAPNVRFSLPQYDLIRLPDKEKKLHLEEIINTTINQLSDIGKAHLFRGVLVKKNKQTNILLLMVHHLICDRLSLDIMMQEVFGFYLKKLNNKKINISPAEYQYIDFSAWQKKIVNNILILKQIEYWKNLFNQEIPALDLPYDYIEENNNFQAGKQFAFNLPASVCESLLNFSNSIKTTLFVTLFGLYKILLHRYTCQNINVVGTPVGTRDHVVFENAVGPFVSFLPIVSSVSPGESVKEYISSINKIILEALENKMVPFEKIVDEFKLKNNVNNIFQVMFIYHVANEMPVLDQFEVRKYPLDNNTSKYDLTLYVERNKEGLQLFFEYNTTLFMEETIERFADSYCRLIKNLLSNCEEKIYKLPIISPKDKKILEKFNARPFYPTDGSQNFIHVINDQINKFPDQIAIIYNDHKVTYKEFNKQAEVIRYHLLAKGFKFGDVVGVMLERSPALISSIWAVIKSGGIYLPLDPVLPKDRINYILNTSKAKIILIENSDEQGWLNTINLNTEIICVDVLSAYAEVSSPGIQNNSTAVIIYTSGSTGLPKGVRLSNAAISNRISWAKCAFPYFAGELCLQRTPISFVDSLAEMFSPLAYGATLVIAAHEETVNPEYFLRKIIKNKINRFTITPTLLKYLLIEQSKSKSVLDNLNIVFTSGEKLPYDLVVKWYSLNPSIPLINLYGCTECCADSTVFNTLNFKKYKTIPIGKSIINTDIYLLDEFFQPVPIGTKGRMFIGGDGLAEGYDNNDALTNEKFIKIKIGNDFKRVYDTGDLARYLFDGNLEYHGRADRQIKLRGIRVEPEEIECFLRGLNEIKDVAIKAEKNQVNDYILIAYLLLNENQDIQYESLQVALRNAFPAYLIPQKFIIVDDFPLTSSGKINYEKISAELENKKYLQECKDIGDTDKILFEIKTIWESIFNNKNIDSNDDFFHLGGHSIMAAQLNSSLRNKFDVTLQQDFVFKFPTISLQSTYIRKLNSNEKIHNKLNQLISDLQ